METILFIVYCLLLATLIGVAVWCVLRAYKSARALEDRLIQLELDADSLFRDVKSLKVEFSLLEKQLQVVKRTLANPHLVVVETELSLPKYAKTTTAEKSATTEQATKKPQAEKKSEQPTEKKTTASFAATHREQYFAYRKQGLNIREAAAKAGISKTTATRYEQWAKKSK